MATGNLSAYGRAGSVEIELHEGEASRLALTIGQFSCTVDVEGAEILERLSAFFDETFRTGRYLDREIRPHVHEAMTPKTLALGRGRDRSLSFEKDGEYDDRYFIVARSADLHLTYVPTLDETIALIEAVRQAAEDAR